MAAALAGIRVHREFYRNSKKYEEMARNLRITKDHLLRSTTREELVEEVEAANHLMLRENQDWRVVFLLQELRG